jgi:TonB-linked SusC/RagA family outer membrane protein
MKHEQPKSMGRIGLYKTLCSIPFFLFPCTLMAVATPTNDVNVVQQQNVVHGTVVDVNGEPIIGASIVIAGKKTGTVTDLDGKFSLQADRGDQITVSYVGYVTQTLKVTGNTLNVKLIEDSKSLNEVVVVGFGTQKKVDLTGAVAAIDGDELAERPVSNAVSALQGMMPGLQISSSTGNLDSNPSINIRGTGTIGEGSSGDPLILIDGAEGDLNTINPQDIESISVLKDAAASSIYGSRAPFGVILVTTKSGKSGGKVTINYNNSFRWSNLIREKHMMNSVDFAAWMNDTNYNGGDGVFFSDERMQQIVAYHNAKPYGPGQRITSDGTILYSIDTVNGTTWADGYAYGIDDVDWYDVVYKNTAFAQEHNASISGGTEKINYYVSFNYLNQDGFMRLSEDTQSRYNGMAKINAQLTDWLRMNYSMRYTRRDYKRPADMTDGMYTNMARQGWPVLPVYDRNGYYYDSPSPALSLATGGKDTKQRDINTQQIGFIIEPIKNWKTHLDFTYRTDNTTRHWDSQRTYNHDVNGNPVIYRQSSNVHEDELKENYFNFQAYSEYSWSLAEKHNFHVMGGFQAEQLKQTAFGLQRDGIIDPDKSEVDLTNGLSYQGSQVIPSVNGSRNQWQTAGFFGRVNYNYDEKYLAEFNIRYDGTSRFRSDHMWRAFPSVSLGWNIAREDFFKPLSDDINLLKLRLSYGSLGNQNTDNWYQTYQTITYNSNSGTWLQNGSLTNTTSAPGLVSTSLTWEKVESYNVGLDWGALNNRLTGSFDFYVRNTKDMVGNAPELPDILGTSVPTTNNTDLRTTGWEFLISWKDALRNGFNYGITFNISDARTKITRYPNNPTNSIWTYIKGRYINEIWGYETEGIAKSDEEMNEHLANADQSALGSNWAAGDIMYKDLNGDKKISTGAETLDDHGDLKVIGNSTPRFLFGLNLTASWKGFDFRAFFQGVLKRDYWCGNSWGGREFYFGATNSGTWWCAGLTAVQDYYRDANSWSVINGYESENTDAFLPRPVYSSKNTECQSKYIMNAAYMRLKNLEIGYTLPTSLVSHIGLTKARIFFSAENLFTITDMPEQFDPETIGTNNNNTYPLSKTYSFGINISF